MRQSWIRLYTEVPNNPKVQRLPGELFKFWINCLCLADNGALPAELDIAFSTRLKPSQVRANIEKLVSAGLIEPNNSAPGSFELHDWDELQFVSDQSNERVKRHRERQRNVTATVTETPPEQSRTEQIQSRTEQNPLSAAKIAAASAVAAETFDLSDEERKVALFPESSPPKTSRLAPEEETVLDVVSRRIHERHPAVRRCGLAEVKKQLRAIARRSPPRKRIDALRLVDANHAAWCMTPDWRKEGGQYAKGLANWINPGQQRWEEPPPQTQSPDVESVEVLSIAEFRRAEGIA